MFGTYLSRQVQYEIQMRVIEIFQGGLINLSTLSLSDGYDEKVDWLSLCRRFDEASRQK